MGNCRNDKFSNFLIIAKSSASGILENLSLPILYSINTGHRRVTFMLVVKQSRVLFPREFEASVSYYRIAMRTIKLLYTVRGFIKGFVKKDNIVTAYSTSEDITPHSIINCAFLPSVCVVSYIHPISESTSSSIRVASCSNSSTSNGVV